MWASGGSCSAPSGRWSARPRGGLPSSERCRRDSGDRSRGDPSHAAATPHPRSGFRLRAVRGDGRSCRAQAASGPPPARGRRRAAVARPDCLHRPAGSHDRGIRAKRAGGNGRPGRRRARTLPQPARLCGGGCDRSGQLRPACGSAGRQIGRARVLSRDRTEAIRFDLRQSCASGSRDT